MALTPGTNLGSYQVLDPLGAGGMGEVYRARDTKLKREVALKVLPELFANDAQRMARFEREAQVLASLNHAQIAHIHGLEEASGIRALVMELVEGPTLSKRIAEGSIPLEETLPIAKKIAEALEYAHERDIIHRDLKPANIKLTADGQVKLLDFGLAKALEGEVGEADISTSPTISAAATRAGVLLGTAAYMSPEQAKGKAVDRRADIWALGCVLYELLAGQPAFDGRNHHRHAGRGGACRTGLGAPAAKDPHPDSRPASTLLDQRSQAASAGYRRGSHRSRCNHGWRSR